MILIDFFFFIYITKHHRVLQTLNDNPRLWKTQSHSPLNLLIIHEAMLTRLVCTVELHNVYYNYPAVRYLLYRNESHSILL